MRKNPDEEKKAENMKKYWEEMASTVTAENGRDSNFEPKEHVELNQYVAINALIENLHSQFKTSEKERRVSAQYKELELKGGEGNGTALKEKQKKMVKETIALFPRRPESSPLKHIDAICSYKRRELHGIGADIKKLEDMRKDKQKQWKPFNFKKPPYSFSELKQRFFDIEPEVSRKVF